MISIGILGVVRFVGIVQKYGRWSQILKSVSNVRAYAQTGEGLVMGGQNKFYTLLGVHVLQDDLKISVGHAEPLRNVGVVVVPADLILFLECNKIYLAKHLVFIGQLQSLQKFHQVAPRVNMLNTLSDFVIHILTLLGSILTCLERLKR